MKVYSPFVLVFVSLNTSLFMFLYNCTGLSASGRPSILTIVPVTIVTEGVFVTGIGIMVGVKEGVVVKEGVTERSNNPPDPQPDIKISMLELMMSRILGFIATPLVMTLLIG